LPNCVSGKTVIKSLILRDLRTLIRRPILGLGLVLISFLPGCTTAPHQNNGADDLVMVEVTALPHPIPAEISHALARPADLWGSIAHDLSWSYDHPSIDVERTHWLSQPFLQATLSERAPIPMQWISDAIRQRQLPMELALVPIVESMLDPWAYSSQRAAGLWQITPSTAAYFGLEVNWWYDARLDIVVATDFALSYLQELYEEFDRDWLLALAAYNGGKGRVRRAIERAGANKGTSITLWDLRLPRETARYVPKILALAQLVKDAEAWDEPWPSLPRHTELSVINTYDQMDLGKVSAITGLPPERIRYMNPALLRWSTPPEGPHDLLLPTQMHRPLAEARDSMSAEEKMSWYRYQIAPGDSLGAIAARFNTEVQLLQSTNDLEDSLIRAGDTLLIPGAGGAQVASLGEIDWPPQRRPRHYTVRSGDSLWSIARRYDLRVSDITKINNLDTQAYIRPGQTLRLAP
jgi:membrane-bound lytic murein transglycosylase D